MFPAAGMFLHDIIIILGSLTRTQLCGRVSLPGNHGICVSPDIRLSGSASSSCSGRVEVFHSNTWGSVCDDQWDINDARVVCRQLGCGAALGAPQSALFGEGSGQIWLKDVACSGSERDLTECRHAGFGAHSCDHSEDAAVICSGDQLVLIKLQSL